MASNKQTLEERLSSLPSSISAELARLSSQPKKSPGSELLKYHDDDILKDYCQNVLHHESVPSTASINKEPEKQVIYGLRLYGNSDAVQAVLKKLTPNEGMYCLAGMYSDPAFCKDEKAGWSPYQLVSYYLLRGIENMAKMHNKLRTKTPKWHFEPYKTSPEFPEAKRIREESYVPSIVKSFSPGFRKESRLIKKIAETDNKDEKQELLFKLDALRDSFSIRLEELSIEELKMLAAYLGRTKISEKMLESYAEYPRAPQNPAPQSPQQLLLGI